MSKLLKNARVRMGTLLAALGVSGIAFAFNQESCTLTVDAAHNDAGVAADEGESEVPVEPGESVEQ